MCGHQNDSQKHSHMLHTYEAAILHAQTENCYIFVIYIFSISGRHFRFKLDSSDSLAGVLLASVTQAWMKC